MHLGYVQFPKFGLSTYNEVDLCGFQRSVEVVGVRFIYERNVLPLG